MHNLGLIDAHSHLDNLAAAKRALETGVTTVRTAGVSAFQDVALMELSRTGKIAGPDVVPAGVYVSPQLEETILADTRLGVLLNGVRTDDELNSIGATNLLLLVAGVVAVRSSCSICSAGHVER
ncbi:MAG: hypothetical protein ACKOC0_04030 [Cytophagales bacterium]